MSLAAFERRAHVFLVLRMGASIAGLAMIVVGLLTSTTWLIPIAAPIGVALGQLPDNRTLARCTFRRELRRVEKGLYWWYEPPG